MVHGDWSIDVLQTIFWQHCKMSQPATFVFPLLHCPRLTFASSTCFFPSFCALWLVVVPLLLLQREDMIKMPSATVEKSPECANWFCHGSWNLEHSKIKTGWPWCNLHSHCQTRYEGCTWKFLFEVRAIMSFSRHAFRFGDSETHADQPAWRGGRSC